MPLWDRPPIDAISVSNTLFSSGTFRITGSSSVTVSSDASGAIVKIDPNAIFGGWRNFEQPDAVMVTNLSAISKTPFYFGEQIPGNLTAASIGFKLSAVTASTVGSLDIHFGVYRKVNSTSMSLMGSGSNNFNLSTASSTLWSGINNFVLTSPGTQTAISSLSGGDYVFGMMFSATATPAMNFSLFGAGGSAALASSPIGRISPGANQVVTGTSQGLQPLHGRGSVTVNVLPTNVVASDLINQGSATAPLRPWMYVRS